ncbi:MAG: hypothetical protein ACOYOU_09840, partial [Kiritimatiellia bacterium]
MKSYTIRRPVGFICVALAMLGAGTFSALAQWPEMPTHKTYVFPSYFPKNGQADYVGSGFTPGFVRNRMDTFYEGWWRETSYYKANPTNGMNVRGYFMDTKTAGEIAMPWAWSGGNVQGAEASIAGQYIADAVADISRVYTGTLDPCPMGGRPITITIGNRTLSDPNGGGQLTGDGYGTVNHSTGAYSFKLNVAAPEGTPIRVSYSYYVQAVAADPGAWANFSAGIGDPAVDRFPDAQGEQFDEFADEDSPSVKYQRFDAFSGKTIDDPLPDGVWTPGERFTDLPGSGTPPNGRWDPYIHAEDTWTPVHTNGGICQQLFSKQMRDYINSPLRGDFFFDYDFSVRAVDNGNPPRVTDFDGIAGLVNTNALIWVADRDRKVNVPFRISEFDLTPPLYYNSLFTLSNSFQNAEEKWTAYHVVTGLASTVLSPSMRTFIDTVGTGDLLADYDFSIDVPTNAAQRVETWQNGLGAPLASSNLVVWLADLGTGTNIPFRINELDLTPPLYFTNFYSTTVARISAEDRWIPAHNVTGISATLTEFAKIKTSLNSTNVGDAILDYDFNCFPGGNYWEELGKTNIQIWIADTTRGTNIPFSVSEMDLTPPLWFTNGITVYGHKGSALVNSDPSPIWEGDAAHTNVTQSIPATYTNVSRMGRFEVNYDAANDYYYMNDSSLSMTVRVYCVAEIITLCTNSPGVAITHPADSLNSFVYSGGKIRVLSKGYDFWNTCVNQTAVAVTNYGYSEVSIPLYYASPLWGKPSVTNGPTSYTNSAAVAGVLNLFEDAIGNDETWTPAHNVSVSSSVACVPVYGRALGALLTNDADRLLEGDAGHTHIVDPINPSPLYTNVARLGRFEYERDSVGRPFVYLSSYGLTLQTYLPEDIVLDCMNNPFVNRDGFMYNGVNIVVVGPPPQGLLTDGSAGWLGFTTPLASGNRIPLLVTVPLYYAQTLWGKPADSNTYTSAAADINNPFVDAVGVDNQWTAATNSSSTLMGALTPKYDAAGNVTADPLPIMEGDAAWTYVRDRNTPPPNLRPEYLNINYLNRIEFNQDGDGNPYVYQSPYEVVIATYVDLPITLFNNMVNNPGVDFGGFTVVSNSVLVLYPKLNFFTAAGGFVANGFPLVNSNVYLRVEAAVHVPLYFSSAIWGAPLDVATYTNPPSVNALSNPYIKVENPFLDAIGNDEKPTPAVPEEPYSDFISWWDPVGGLGATGVWVPGITGSPRGTLPPGSTATADYWVYNSTNVPPPRKSYVHYIMNNYPGDTNGLIQRCANHQYDGPENWDEQDNNQMIQTGFIDPTVLSSAPVFWDYRVDTTSITSYSAWWMRKFGSAPTYSALIPIMSEWKPQLTDANQELESTVDIDETAFGTVVTTNFGSLTHPPGGTTWTYDSPREFCDLASSMYHNPDLGSMSALKMRRLSYRPPGMPPPDDNALAVWDGGDMRLGEQTSPWSPSIFGVDNGDDDPKTADFAGDKFIPGAGPYAYHTHGNYGYDAQNQLNLEFSTWRINGKSFTGPRGPSKAAGYDYTKEKHANWRSAVYYTGDHRDVNLNGLI